MESIELIPDVLDKEPKSVLTVQFENVAVQQGNKVTIQQVSKQPIRLDWQAEAGKFYTLCFTDPDAPSRETPTVREWVHWLVVNIPGDTKDLSAGETLIDFVPSSPGEASGVHRYTFVLFEQPSKLDFSQEPARFNKSVEHRALRRHFSIRTFAKKYGFGDAFAGNFYLTEWDSYVNVVRKELGLE